jgi:hypothetical protein
MLGTLCSAPPLLNLPGHSYPFIGFSRLMRQLSPSLAVCWWWFFVSLAGGGATVTEGCQNQSVICLRPSRSSTQGIRGLSTVQIRVRLAPRPGFEKLDCFNCCDHRREGCHDSSAPFTHQNMLCCWLGYVDEAGS